MLHGLFEHNRPVFIDQDVVVQMVPYSAGQNHLLEVAPLADHVLDRVLVIYTYYVLLDDRSGIQFGSRIMAGGTDDLHPPVMRGVVGAGAP